VPTEPLGQAAKRRDDSLSDPSIGLEDASKLETRSYIKLCPAATS
jgi:hypothetical protein